nr:response regulator [Spirochaetales bacterium]
ELYLKHKPDLILMDIVMPGIDGYQATRMIRSKDEKTPIIAMTAKAYREDRENCLDAGMDDYISKPVSLERLKEMLEKYL